MYTNFSDDQLQFSYFIKHKLETMEIDMGSTRWEFNNLL